MLAPFVLMTWLLLASSAQAQHVFQNGREEGSSQATERLRAQLAQLDRETRAVRERRPHVFLPIATISMGGVVGILGALSAIATADYAHKEHYAWDVAGNRYRASDVDPEQRRAARLLGVGSLLGFGIASVGIALLVPRARLRKQLNQQLLQHKQQRLELLRQLSIQLGSGHVHAQLGWAF